MLFAAPAGDDATRASLLRVVDVRAVSSLVDPVGWTPDRRRTHPVVVASVPLPRAAVVIGGLPGDAAAAADLVRAAVGGAGPGGGASLDVRVVGDDEQVDGLRLRVVIAEVAGREDSTPPPRGGSSMNTFLPVTLLANFGSRGG